MSVTTSMSLVIAAGAIIAAAAAVRSTWSPCGLSMLSTITPFTERARGHSFRATAAWFVAGASVGGASLGVLMGAGAAVVRQFHVSADGRLWAAGVAALVAVTSDGALVGQHLPIHRRQVNERWLDGYRPWVYGAGFGWQIGAGLVTYITSAAVYLLVVLGALTAAPFAALVLGTWFGLLRGLAVLLTARVRSPGELLSFHRRFEAALPRADRLVRGTEVAVVLGTAVTLATPASLGVLGGLGLVVGGLTVLRRRHRRVMTRARPTTGQLA
jgi:hypothetical protein